MNTYFIWGAFLIGGLVIGYILAQLQKPIGVLKIYDDMDEGHSYIFMELNEEFHEFRANSIVKLRVKNASYYENQNS